MTNVDYQEALNIIIEYARTKMLCIDEGQRKLLIEFNNIMGGKDNDIHRQPLWIQQFYGLPKDRKEAEERPVTIVRASAVERKEKKT